ncbi:response regulator transcription factor [Rhodobacteraceae bacterium CCMM004]|nr:response regulator transcription factor [Rhodobacteraceae bacterium CCMM004]
MHGRHVLVVDDDAGVRHLLRRCLEAAGATVSEADCAAAARAAIAERSPDLVTLDLNLEDGDGLDVARDIRRTSALPIVIVSGKDDVIDRVVGLELGADDYITKPFHVREVMARLHAVLRRSGDSAAPGRADDAEAVRLDGLTLWPQRFEVTGRDGAPCPLTGADFRLLMAFVGHPGQALSRDRLMDLTGGGDWAPLDRTIDNQVARLRKKIERDPANPRLIRTVRGVGYRLVADVRLTTAEAAPDRRA